MLMEIDISDYTCADAYEMGKDGSSPRPVPLCASGQGLPYAPVDWPNPGDIWAWKVGNKVSPMGYYIHRSLLVPKSLQKSPTRKIWLGSKLAITRFLQSEFPKADIDAFFASFTWKIPAEKRSTKKGKTIAGKKRTSSLRAITEKQAKSGSQITMRTRNPTKKDTSLASQITMRTRNSTKNDTSLAAQNTTSIDMNSPPNQFAKATPIGSQNPADQNALACRPHDSKSLADHLAEMSSEEFEIYLNSLDVTLTHSAPINSGAQLEGFARARDELSSLLSIGVPNLIASNKLQEVKNLSSKLESDPYLTQEEHSMLNLIHEIPLASKDLAEAIKSSVGPEANADQTISLKIQYVLCKDKIALLQAEDASASTSIQEIDQEIAELQSRRAKLAKGVMRNQTKIAELLSTQNQVFDSVAKVADVAPMSSSRVSQRQMKQKGVSKQGAEILAKFAPLKGFSFRR